MNNTSKKDSPLPFLAAMLVITLMLGFMYYEEIIRWLYANNLWYLPIRL